MLLGLGGIPLKPQAALALLDDKQARQELTRVREAARELTKALPSQAKYIASLHRQWSADSG